MKKHVFSLAALAFCVAIFWYQTSVEFINPLFAALGLLLTVLLPIVSAQYIYTGNRKNWATILGVIAMMCVLVFVTDTAATYDSAPYRYHDCINCGVDLLTPASGARANVATSTSSIMQFAGWVFAAVLFLSIVNFGLVLARIFGPKKQQNQKDVGRIFVRSRLFWPVMIIVSVGVSLATLYVPTPQFMQPSEASDATSYYGIPYAAREVSLQDGGGYGDCWGRATLDMYSCTDNLIYKTSSMKEETTYNVVGIMVNAVVWSAIGAIAALSIRRSYQ